jgi:hypothetical protein
LAFAEGGLQKLMLSKRHGDGEMGLGLVIMTWRLGGKDAMTFGLKPRVKDPVQQKHQQGRMLGKKTMITTITRGESSQWRREAAENISRLRIRQREASVMKKRRHRPIPHTEEGWEGAVHKVAR